jgi:SAM-dependent methyltransferase
MFFSTNTDELSKYIEMLNNEHLLGTSYYERHDLNPLYWDYLLGPIKENPGLWENKKAFDLGTGLGRNVTNLLKLANWNRIDAVDLSKKNVDQCTATFEEKCKFHKVSGRNLKIFKNEQFDFVISSLLFQFLAVYELRYKLMEEVYRTMKNYGVFTFQMGYGSNIHERNYPDKFFCLMRTGTLTVPVNLKVANYYDNIYDAIGSNGEYDVRVTSPEQIISDLTKIGFKNITYKIEKSYDDYIHTQWIYVQCSK